MEVWYNIDMYNTKQWLFEQYVIQEKSSQKISEIAGVGRKTIDKWLKSHNIEKRGCGGSKGKPTKEELENEYIKNGKSLNGLAEMYKVDRKTAHRWLIGYEIPMRKQGEEKADKCNAWRGGRYYTNGYKMLYAPNHHKAVASKYVYEHILVAEKALGRDIKKPEVLHHINRNKLDNRVENLYLFKNHSEHMKFHRNPIKLESNLVSNN